MVGDVQRRTDCPSLGLRPEKFAEIAGHRQPFDIAARDNLDTALPVLLVGLPVARVCPATALGRPDRLLLPVLVDLSIQYAAPSRGVGGSCGKRDTVTNPGLGDTVGVHHRNRAGHGELLCRTAGVGVLAGQVPDGLAGIHGIPRTIDHRLKRIPLVDIAQCIVQVGGQWHFSSGANGDVGTGQGTVVADPGQGVLLGIAVDQGNAQPDVGGILPLRGRIDLAQRLIPQLGLVLQGHHLDIALGIDRRRPFTTEVRFRDVMRFGPGQGRGQPEAGIARVVLARGKIEGIVHLLGHEVGIWICQPELFPIFQLNVVCQAAARLRLGRVALLEHAIQGENGEVVDRHQIGIERRLCGAIEPGESYRWRRGRTLAHRREAHGVGQRLFGMSAHPDIGFRRGIDRHAVRDRGSSAGVSHGDADRDPRGCQGIALGIMGIQTGGYLCQRVLAACVERQVTPHVQRCTGLDVHCRLASKLAIGETKAERYCGVIVIKTAVGDVVGMTGGVGVDFEITLGMHHAPDVDTRPGVSDGNRHDVLDRLDLGKIVGLHIEGVHHTGKARAIHVRERLEQANEGLLVLEREILQETGAGHGQRSRLDRNVPAGHLAVDGDLGVRRGPAGHLDVLGLGENFDVARLFRIRVVERVDNTASLDCHTGLLRSGIQGIRRLDVRGPHPDRLRIADETTIDRSGFQSNVSGRSGVLSSGRDAARRSYSDLGSLDFNIALPCH